MSGCAVIQDLSRVDGDTVRLSGDVKRRISDHVRGIELFGVASHARHRHFSSWGFVRHIDGLIAHSIQIEDAYGRKMRNRFRTALTAEGWPIP
jgi:RNA-directed DNA polymerase